MPLIPAMPRSPLPLCAADCGLDDREDPQTLVVEGVHLARRPSSFVVLLQLAVLLSLDPSIHGGETDPELLSQLHGVIERPLSAITRSRMYRW